MPEPDGETVTLNEKVYVPVKEHPDVSTASHLFVIAMRPSLRKRVAEMTKFETSLSASRADRKKRKILSINA